MLIYAFFCSLIDRPTDKRFKEYTIMSYENLHEKSFRPNCLRLIHLPKYSVSMERRMDMSSYRVALLLQKIKSKLNVIAYLIFHLYVAQ